MAKKTYYNLTDDLVRTFVATCPVCNGPADNPVFTAGNKYRFRDQYTTTIIDQSRDPVTDFNGVTMRYLLVLQDNTTKFTVLRPIRRVDPCVLKCELKFIFGMIGYPRKTFKSDEDYVELQSGLIRKLIHQRNSECAYELGAVEELKSTVNQVIEQLEVQIRLGDQAEDDDERNNSNWVTHIPMAMEILNGKSYAKVFGMDLTHLTGAQTGNADHSLIHEEILTPSFMSVEHNFDRVEDVKYDRYQSDTTNGTDEEVNNDNADGTTRYTNEAHDIDNDNSASDLDLECLDDDALDMIKLVDSKPRYSEVLYEKKNNVYTALKEPKCLLVTVDGTPYRVVYPRLRCPRCEQLCSAGSQSVTVVENSYYDLFLEEKRWWTTDMVSTFGILKSHDAHNGTVVFIDPGLPDKDGITKKNVHQNWQLPKSVQTIITVATRDRHFVVLELQLHPRNTTVVYDGYSATRDDLDKWRRHEEHLLARCGIYMKEATPKWITRKYDFRRDLKINRLRFDQSDDYNCGPIACRVVWELLSPREADNNYASEVTGRPSMPKLTASTDPADWRKMIITEMKVMLTKYSQELIVKKRHKKEMTGVNNSGGNDTSRSVKPRTL